MPTRMIRDGILTSERVNALTERAELFYRRLMSVVDDYGRFSANPTLLRASCYPLKLDSVKEDSIKKHLAEAVDAGLIVLYTVASKQYLQLQDFGQRVQSKSKYPDPPALPTDPPKLTVIHRESPGVTALDGDEVEGGDEGEVEGVNPCSPRAGDVIGIVVDAYHAALPRCQACEVLTPKREKAIKHADKLARSLCEQQGWTYDAAQFWEAYFGECAQDAWMRGDVPNPKNPKWKQNLGVLIAEERFATVMDQAITSMRRAA